MTLPVLGILALVFFGTCVLCTRTISGSFIRQEIEERASVIYSYMVGRSTDLTRIHYIKLSDVVNGTLTLEVCGVDEGGGPLKMTLTREGSDIVPKQPPPKIAWALGMFSEDSSARANLWPSVIGRLADISNNHGRIRAERSNKPLFIEIIANSQYEGDGTYSRLEAAGKR